MNNDQPMESSMSSATSMAFRNWQMSNNVESLETIYQYDSAEQQAIRAVKPWEKDPHYFKVEFFISFSLVNYASPDSAITKMEHRYSSTIVA